VNLKGKQSPLYVISPPCHPRGAGNCNPLRQGLHNGTLKVFEIFKNEKDC